MPALAEYPEDEFVTRTLTVSAERLANSQEQKQKQEKRLAQRNDREKSALRADLLVSKANYIK